MLLHRTPPKAAADPDPAKPVKWLRCLQCNKKFPENEFKAHQRESKSPCELVRAVQVKRDGRLCRWVTHINLFFFIFCALPPCRDGSNDGRNPAHTRWSRGLRHRGALERSPRSPGH